MTSSKFAHPGASTLTLGGVLASASCGYLFPSRAGTTMADGGAMAESRKNAKRGSIMGFLAGLALDEDEDEDSAQDKKKKGSSTLGRLSRRLSLSSARRPSARSTDDTDADDGPRAEAAHWEKQQQKGLRLSKSASRKSGASGSRTSSSAGQLNRRSGPDLNQLSTRGSSASGRRLSQSLTAFGGLGSGPIHPSGGDRLGEWPDDTSSNPMRNSGRQRLRSSMGGEPGEEPPSWMKPTDGPKVLSEVSRGTAQRTRI